VHSIGFAKAAGRHRLQRGRLCSLDWCRLIVPHGHRTSGKMWRTHVTPALRIKIKHIVFAVLSCIFFAIAWIRLAPGSDRQALAVKPEDRVCTQDADCQLVEVPCTCGQLQLAVNVQHYKRYERHAVCTSSEISHCAAAGASLPQSAVCRVGRCTAVVSVPTSPE
jgi:hypothetical protein